MATTIPVRLVVNDDSGTPSAPVGDGDPINNDVLQDLQDIIDGLIGANILFGGTVSSEAGGIHSFAAGPTGSNRLQVRNTAAGTGNFAGVEVGNDNTAEALRLLHMSTTWTTGAPFIQDGGALVATRPGGLSIGATNAAGGLRIYTGGSTLRLSISSAGVVALAEGTLMNCGVLAYNSAADAGVTSGSAIDFDTEVYDEGGHFSGDTFTAPTTGRYRVDVGVGLQNLTGGAIDMGAIILPSAGHGLGFVIGNEAAVPNNGYRSFAGGVTLNLTAADTVTVTYFGGGNATVLGDLSTGYRYTYISVRRVL